MFIYAKNPILVHLIIHFSITAMVTNNFYIDFNFKLKMGVLRIKVECHRCKNVVDKLDARELSISLTRTPRYECFTCFRKFSHISQGNELVGASQAEKQQLYCGKCRYKFSSIKFVCPYCGESDNLMRSNMSIQDII